MRRRRFFSTVMASSVRSVSRPSSASEVAFSIGRSSRVRVTLMPMPTTTRAEGAAPPTALLTSALLTSALFTSALLTSALLTSALPTSTLVSSVFGAALKAWPTGPASARMPHSLLPSICTSFGHFSTVPSIESVTARPAASGRVPRCSRDSGSKSTEKMTWEPAGAVQVRPRRPLPESCSSASSTVPSATLVACIKSVLVEPVFSTKSMVVKSSASAVRMRSKSSAVISFKDTGRQWC